MDEINAILLGTNMYDDGYNQALEDAEKRYREWSKSEYGKVVSDDALPIRVLRSLRK